MADPTGDADKGALRLDFDRRLMLQFRGSAITSDAGLLPYRELDDAVGLTEAGADTLADARTGKNGRHLLVGLLRQSVFGRLAGYEDVNDAELPDGRGCGVAADVQGNLDAHRSAAGATRAGMKGLRGRKARITTEEVRLDERKATGCSLASRATRRIGCNRGWLRSNFVARRPHEAEHHAQRTRNPGNVG
jgi:hypothetical protein